MVKAAKSANRAALARAVKFADFADGFIRSHAPSWKNSKHKDQWTNTLATYAYPILGSMVVTDVDTPAVLRVLQPIWYEKTETATRLRGRIEMVLDAATTQGLREGPNPARWKGHLALALPKPSKITTVTHQKSLPVDEVPGLWSLLTAAEGLGALALRFLLLTCARSGEVRGAKWSEIDLGSRVWTIPAAQMKAGKEHRVWLSDAALNILTSLPRTSSFVFPSPKGSEMSDMTLSAVMRRMQLAAVPHGLRSSFRTWAAERTNHPREVCEQCLAHTTGSDVELAYQRSDLFEKRRQVLSEWARFVTTETKEGDKSGAVAEDDCMADSEFEAEAIRRAIAGDIESGFEVLRRCRTGLDNRILSPQLAYYLADRIAEILDGQTPKHALRIAKRPGRGADPLPDWEMQLGSFAALLAQRGYKTKQIATALCNQRAAIHNLTLEQSDAYRIAKTWQPMNAMDGDDLLGLIKDYKEVLKEYPPLK